MTASFSLGVNRSCHGDVVEHLHECDASFVPRLSERVVIPTYAKKIMDHSTRIEAWADATLIGLVAFYSASEPNEPAFITNVSVLPSWQRKNIGCILIAEIIRLSSARGIKCLKLQVQNSNCAALRLYEKLGFVGETSEAGLTMMKLQLTKESQP